MAHVPVGGSLRARLGGRFDRWVRRRQPGALPVRFDRRGIYVLPTAFGLFFLGLLLAMGVGALNYNNNPALLLALLLAGAAHTSLVMAHLQLSGLAITAVTADPVPAGMPMPVRVHAAAPPGRARHGLRVRCADAVAALSLPGDSAQALLSEAMLSLPTLRRGWLPLPRLTVSTTRPLGLARAWSYAWPDVSLLVYPAPEPHGPPLPPAAGSQASARLQPVGDDAHHLRNYRRGDAPRAIAWKASARRDTLLVREYEQPGSANVVLDWHDLAELLPEARIARLARWVDEAEREGRRTTLRLPGLADEGPGMGAAHRHACLKALALLPHPGVRA